MRALVQRVSSASVSIGGEDVGRIGRGMLILLGIRTTDTERELEWMVHKCAGLRIFDDGQGRMNLSLKEIRGAVLVVSQFTLYGDAHKGFRPGFTEAARPDLAIPLYERFLKELAAQEIPVQCGRFGADMQVSLVNDGPVTILLEREAGDSGPRGS